MPETPHSPRFFVENTYPVGEVTLRVASSPAGDPPLVMLHGVTRRWQTFLPVAAQLTTRFRLHAVDLRGHGGSTRGAAYRTVDYVDDIVHLLRDHLRESVVLYGHSLGSMVAAAVAATAPEAVRALILEDPPFHTMGDRIRQTRLHSYFQAVYDLVHAKLPFAELLRRLPEIRMVDPQTNGVQRLGDVRDAVFLRFTAQSLTQLDPRVMEPIVDATWLKGYDWREIIPSIAAPTLLLRADPAAGGMLIDEDARWCEQHLRDGTSLYYPGAAHLIHWARSQELASHVLGFLASLDH